MFVDKEDEAVAVAKAAYGLRHHIQYKVLILDKEADTLSEPKNI